MTKSQFISIVSGFIAPYLINAFVEQAESKGYFNESQFTENIYSALKKKIIYAKSTLSPIRNLYEAKGAIDMARQLGAITHDQYIELDHKCVYEGINNPEYMKKED